MMEVANLDEGSGELQLVVFRLGREEYGIDITRVREIIRVTEITRIPNSPPFIEGVINLRGQITTVMDLRKKLGVKAENTEQTRIMIVELSDSTTIGMIVDAVTEVMRLPKKDIEFSLTLTTEDAEYIYGVGKIKDRLLILIDVDKLVPRNEREIGAETAQATA